MFNRDSWRWRLPWLFVAVSVLGVGSFGVVAYAAVYRSTLAAAQARVKSVLAEINTITELGVANQLDSLQKAARDPAIVRALQQPDRPLSDDAMVSLRRLQGTSPASIIVELVGADGEIQHALPGFPAAASDNDTFPFPAEPVIGPMYERAGGVYFQAAVSVRDAENVAGGLRVTRRLGATSANRLIAAKLLGNDAMLLVGNRGGALWCDSRRINYPTSQASPIRYRRDGVEWVSASAPVRDTPWLYAVDFPERDALAPAHAIVWPLLAAGGVIALAGGWIGLRVGARISRPLEGLTAASEAIARGDRDVRVVDTHRTDEVGQLSHAFATMAASVRGVQDHLESEVVARTGALIDARERLGRLHEELLTSQRLATLGRLSGSASHELRNPLGVMSNVVFLIDAMPEASGQLKDYANVLRQQIRMAERIISDLLDRARLGRPLRSAVELARLIDEILVRAAVPSNARIERRELSALPTLSIDRDQVGQILWNLVRNALQVMREDGGTLTITSAFGDGRLTIEVSDCGPGVADADSERVFEPLFTTKPDGVGFGLSISRAFARANGGDLRVRRADGGGACFVLDLPATPA